jgi:nucleoside-diphosphate-sugar epimerase
VLVTGGSGFVASRCILQLLAAGYRVRTTVRRADREPVVWTMLAEGGVDPGEPLSCVVADLDQDAGWPDAVAGCQFVLHVASPLPTASPANEDDLIRPARDGALRVLRAARDAGVRRVVLTSSFAAVGYGQPARTTFDETNWTDITTVGLSPYVKSKTIAERAAWDFVAHEGGGLELATINPVGVFGPVVGSDYAASITLVKRMLDGRLPGSARVCFGVVDVRDVADLHIRAMTNPKAPGERFLACAGEFIWMAEVARILKRRLGESARKVSTREIPNWLVRLVSIWNRTVRQTLPELGKVKTASNEKAKRVLGWSPRSNEDAIVASGESLVRLGLVGGPRR